MLIEGKMVVSVMRVSPKLLVCGLEGDRTYEFRGDKAYVDGQERLIKHGLAENAVLAMNADSSAPRQQEPLIAPTYNANDPRLGQRDPAPPTLNAEVGQNVLPFPQYDTARFQRQ
jgi:hypothetical protein